MRAAASGRDHELHPQVTLRFENLHSMYNSEIGGLEADHRRHAEIENTIRDLKSLTTPLTAFTRPLTRTGMNKSDTSRLWIYWSSVTKTPTGRWTDCRTSTVDFPAHALLTRYESFGNISQ